MAEIRLYGKLRRYAKDSPDSITHVTAESNETLEKLLDLLGIPLEEIYSIFYNSKLLAARSGMARWIDYQQVFANPFNWNLSVPAHSEDRIGL